MAEVKLTQQQREAVENRGGNLLVSAAAGSGKTKVLVERLFRYVVEERRSVDEFLIITYTRAAAAELRGRIAEELTGRLADDPENRHLQQQLYRIYRADIKTVDAFCTALLRENVHLLPGDGEYSLTADFRVLEENEAQLLRSRVLARVLETFYGQMGEGDVLLADTLGFGRDDRSLEELVLNLYDKLQSHAYPRRWMHREAAFWQQLPRGVEDTPYGKILLEGVARKASYWAEALDSAAEEMGENPALEKGYASGFRNVAEQLRRLIQVAEKDWDGVCSFSLVFPRLGAVKDKDGGEQKARMKALWELCKKEWKTHSGVFSLSSREAMEDLAAMAPAMVSLLQLTERFDRAYHREKLRRNVTDFSDQEHYAVELLLDGEGNPTELCRRAGARYFEIMVDEYQDTNEVQNCIFEALARERRNLFTVGDVKQSIYRFRLADPTIFLEKYRRFRPSGEAADGEDRKILLSRNFRSRQEVLEAANFLFAQLLSQEMGEMDYGPEEQLYPGAEYYPPSEECGVEFHLLDVPADGDRFAPRRPLLEARFVAERIALMLREGYSVRDEDSGQLRPCRPGDFAVLMRSPGPRLRQYIRAFAEYGIPCSAQEDEEFFARMEVAVTISLLEILDNPRQDVPLISALRSPVFGFSPDRLAVIRGKHPQGDFYDALQADDAEDTADFLDKLVRLRDGAKDIQVHQLLSRICEELHLPAVFGAMPGGEERRQNLESLYAYAREFEASGYRGLFAFVSHLRELLEQGQQPMAAVKPGGDSVQIMSIHKSKGLEFPVVILADLAKEFNRQDLQSPVLVHPVCGLGPVRVDLARRIRYPTVARQAVEAQLSREGKSEELRVLYVAMTRAKEKLIMVASLRHAAGRLAKLAAVAACPVAPNTVAEAKSMAEWILLPLLCRSEARELRLLGGVEPQRYVLTEDHQWKVSLHQGQCYAKPPRPVEGAAEAEEKGRPISFDPALLSFAYPHAAAAQMPTKITATQLKGRLVDQELEEDMPSPVRGKDIFARPAFLERRAVTPDQRGSATHRVMQYLEFTCADVEGTISRLVQERFLTEEEGASVDCGAIRRFLCSPLAEQLRHADKVWREYRFSLLMPGEKYWGERALGEEVLLQGVVDCFFDTPEGLVVVDFKTDRVKGEEQRRRTAEYRSQVEAYSDALEKIFHRPVCRKILYYFHTNEAIVL